MSDLMSLVPLWPVYEHKHTKYRVPKVQSTPYEYKGTVRIKASTEKIAKYCCLVEKCERRNSEIWYIWEGVKKVLERISKPWYDCWVQNVQKRINAFSTIWLFCWKMWKVESVTLDTVDLSKKVLDRISKPWYDYWVQNK